MSKFIEDWIKTYGKPIHRPWHVRICLRCRVDWCFGLSVNRNTSMEDVVIIEVIVVCVKISWCV